MADGLRQVTLCSQFLSLSLRILKTPKKNFTNLQCDGEKGVREIKGEQEREAEERKKAGTKCRTFSMPQTSAKGFAYQKFFGQIEQEKNLWAIEKYFHMQIYRTLHVQVVVVFVSVSGCVYVSGTRKQHAHTDRQTEREYIDMCCLLAGDAASRVQQEQE